MTQPAEPAKKTGNVFTRKIGPLPGWAWAGIAGGVTYLYVKHRNASTSSDDTSDDDDSDATDADEDDTGIDSGTADDGGDGSGGDYSGTPYTGAGGLQTALTAADASLSTAQSTAATDAKKLTTYQANHPAGSVAKKKGVFTASAATTLAKVSNRLGVTVAQLKKDNPNLKSDKITKGEKIHYTLPAKKAAAKS
jgi:hypothetical protein